MTTIKGTNQKEVSIKKFPHPLHNLRKDKDVDACWHLGISVKKARKK